MNIRFYKEDWFFMAFSILALGAAAHMGQTGIEADGWQEQLTAVLDLVAYEIPHTY